MKETPKIAESRLGSRPVEVDSATSLPAIAPMTKAIRGTIYNRKEDCRKDFVVVAMRTCSPTSAARGLCTSISRVLSSSPRAQLPLVAQFSQRLLLVHMTTAIILPFNSTTVPTSSIITVCYPFLAALISKRPYLLWYSRILPRNLLD